MSGTSLRAMLALVTSFAVLGCHDLHGDGRSWLAIKDPASCAKTFPHFFELLEALRQKSLAH